MKRYAVTIDLYIHAENDSDAKWDTRDYILEEIGAIFEKYNIDVEELIQ